MCHTHADRTGNKIRDASHEDNTRFTDFRVVKHRGVNVPDLLHCTYIF